MANVTIFSPQNMYSYRRENLLLAYSIGVGLTLLSAGLGILAMTQSQASFSNSISTILRASRTSELDSMSDQGGARGADPLPKELAHVKINFTEVDVDDDEALTRELGGTKNSVSYNTISSENEHLNSTYSRERID